MNTMRHPLVLLGTLALASCRGVPPIEVTPSVASSPALAAVNPMEIAVLPVEDDTLREEASWLLGDMRVAASRALVERKFTPLAPGHVDSRLASASDWTLGDTVSLARLCGRFEEDAILAIRVRSWDESEIMSSARVRFDLEAVLIGGSEKQVLWNGRLEGVIKAGGAGPAMFDREDRARDVAGRAAAALVKLLDERRV